MNYIFNTYDVASKLKYKDIAKHSTTTNGKVKSTITGKLQAELTLIHKVDVEAKDLFSSFYNTNKNVIIDVTYGEVDYTLYFQAAPRYIPLNGDMWKITAKLASLAGINTDPGGILISSDSFSLITSDGFYLSGYDQ